AGPAMAAGACVPSTPAPGRPGAPLAAAGLSWVAEQPAIPSVAATSSRAAPRILIRCSLQRVDSEPEPDARHPCAMARAVAVGAAQVRGAAERAPVHDAQVGREPPVHFIAQPRAGLDLRQPGTHAACHVVAAVGG